jgi:hypothetical protein
MLDDTAFETCLRAFCPIATVSNGVGFRGHGKSSDEQVQICLRWVFKLHRINLTPASKTCVSDSAELSFVKFRPCSTDRLFGRRFPRLPPKHLLVFSAKSRVKHSVLTDSQELTSVMY